MTWLDLGLFLVLFGLFVYVLAANAITLLHKVYLLFHFFMMLWPLGQIAVHTTDYPQLQLIYIKVSFVGLSMLGFGWLLFTRFLANHAYKPDRFALLRMALPPVVVMAGIMWNPLHIFIDPVDGNYEERVYGPAFWVMVAVLLSYCLYSIKVLWRALRVEASVQDRPRIADALTGIVILVGFALLDLLLNVALGRWLPVIPGLTSLGIVISDFYFVFSIRRHRMFDIINIARQDVADTMSVGVIVLDEQDFVIEKNSVVLPALGVRVGDYLDMEDLLASFEDSDRHESFLESFRLRPKEHAKLEVTARQDGKVVYLLMQVAPIIVRQQALGRVITFQDNTELRKLIAESYRQYELLQERNRALLVMQDALYQANQKLERMAITDSLTGCFNRRYLMQQLEHEVLTNVRYRIPFAIFLFDIDLFKTVNDTYGHLVGDDVIRRTADIVRSVLRRTDILARYGGEEFTVYLPHTNREQAEMLAHRIRSEVERSEIAQGRNNEPVSITISMGVVAIEPQTGAQIDDAKAYLRELFARVDAALYQAKESGRNRIVNF